MPSNSAREKEFFQALRFQKHDQVRALVQETPELLHALDAEEFGGTALNETVSRGDREGFELLLELGADVNVVSDWEPGPWTALQLALCHGRDEMAESLVQRGAKIGMHEAAGLGRIADLERLLTERPEALHERGGDGCLPLHFARNAATVDWLLDHGAEIEARDVDHYSTAQHYLCTTRPEAAIRLMDRGAEPNVFSIIAAGDVGRLARIIAETPEQLRWILDEARFPPSPDGNSCNVMNFTLGWQTTPLHAAAKVSRLDVMRLLLEAGVDVNVRGDYDNCTPLHMAAWHDLPEVARFLLDHGANLEAESGELHRNTPAGWAIVAGSDRALAVFFERGAAVRDYYLREAENAAAGAFRCYKWTRQANNDRVLALVKRAVSA